MSINKKSKKWSSEENRLRYEKNYRQCFRASLAIEGYCDDNSNDEFYQDEAFKDFYHMNKIKYDISENELVSFSETVAYKFMRILNKIGL